MCAFPLPLLPLLPPSPRSSPLRMPLRCARRFLSVGSPAVQCARGALQGSAKCGDGTNGEGRSDRRRYTSSLRRCRSQWEAHAQGERAARGVAQIRASFGRKAERIGHPARSAAELIMHSAAT